MTTLTKYGCTITFTQEERLAQATAEAITSKARQLLDDRKTLTLEALLPRGIVIGSKAEASVTWFCRFLQRNALAGDSAFINGVLTRMGAKLTNILLNHSAASISRDARLFETLCSLNNRNI